MSLFIFLFLTDLQVNKMTKENDRRNGTSRIPVGNYVMFNNCFDGYFAVCWLPYTLKSLHPKRLYMHESSNRISSANTLINRKGYCIVVAEITEAIADQVFVTSTKCLQTLRDISVECLRFSFSGQQTS